MTGCTHHMGVPGRACPWRCGTVVPEFVASAPHGAARVAEVADGGGSTPVVSLGHEIARPGGEPPPPHPVGSQSAPEVAAERKQAAGSPSSPGSQPPGPVARRTDPATSHAAAASVTADKQRDSHRLVLALLAEYGPLSDFDLARLASAARGHMVKPTSLGVRRGELVRAGLVAEFDRRGVSDTGSACIRWALVESAQLRMEVAA